MLQTILGIILLVAAVFLVVAVLMQSGKSHNLSGAIAGGADTFFGKTKGKTIDKMLSKLTTIVAICFVLLVIVVYVIQDDNDLAAIYQEYLNSLNTTTADTAEGDTTAEADAALTDAGVDTSADAETAAETAAADAETAAEG